MFRLLSVLVVGVAFFAYATPSYAEDLEGTIQCCKCHLKKADKCATAIVVKGKDGKETVYVFDAEADKKYHDDICRTKKEGTVSGTVKKDGDKMVITVKELKYKKQ